MPLDGCVTTCRSPLGNFFPERDHLGSSHGSEGKREARPDLEDVAGMNIFVLARTERLGSDGRLCTIFRTRWVNELLRLRSGTSGSRSGEEEGVRGGGWWGSRVGNEIFPLISSSSFNHPCLSSPKLTNASVLRFWVVSPNCGSVAIIFWSASSGSSIIASDESVLSHMCEAGLLQLDGGALRFAKGSPSSKPNSNESSVE